MNIIIIYYISTKDSLEINKINISNKNLLIIITIGFIICAYLVSKYTINRFHAFRALTYDFGIFAQMFEYLAKIGRPLTTLERDGLLSHFAVHFSPIYYLFLPGYFIFRTPEYLLVIQALLIFAGVLPIYLLCKEKNLKNFYILLISFIYLLYPALTAGSFFDFHENKFLTIFILWFLYFLEKEKKPHMYILMFLTLMIKEDAALYIMFIGIYKLFSDKNKKIGINILISGLIYFVLAIFIVSLFGGEVMTNRFDNYWSTGTSGFYGLFKTVFLNFGYLINQVMTEKKLEFLILMLLPISFLPIYNKKISNLILLVPMLVINLMPNYIYQYNINYQYTYGVTALLFYGLIINISEIKNNKLKNILLLISLLSTIYIGLFVNYDKFKLYKNIDHNLYIEKKKCLEKLPLDAEITASTFLTGHLSKYDVVYMYPSQHETEYVIVDLLDDPTLMLIELENKGYTNIFKCNEIDIYQKLTR